MIYSEKTWNDWVEKIEKRGEPKRYYHFDQPFEFEFKKGDLLSLLSNPDSVASHPFLPFVRRKVKTRRFRYEKEKEEYKGSYKIRPIAFASHLDTYLFSFYAYALNEKYQDYIRDHGFSDSVLAYRTDLEGKCNIQFAKEVFEFIRSTGECTAIAFDIKGYFDHIDHLKLKEKWGKLLKWAELIDENQLPKDHYAIFKAITKYSFVDYNTVVDHFDVNFEKVKQKEKVKTGRRATITDLVPGVTFSEKMKCLRDRNLIVPNKSHEVMQDGSLRYFGIPQGSSISAFLSNLYLLDFDHEIAQYCSEKKYLYRRYCDDILLVVPNEVAEDIQQFVMDAIAKYHLEIQKKKTEIVSFHSTSKGKIRSFDQKTINDENVLLTPTNEELYFKKLQYLGFEFNGQNIYIRSSSLARYFRKMKRRILRSVLTAYGKKGWSKKVFRKQIYERYTHKGKRNFIAYAHKASKEFYENREGEKKEGMNDPKIRKQISRHFEKVIREITEKEVEVRNSKLRSSR